MNYSLGQFIGGIFAIAILCVVFRVILKRFLVGNQLILTSVACSVALATFLYAFGAADGGAPKFGAAFAQYGFGGVVVLIAWLVKSRAAGKHS